MKAASSVAAQPQRESASNHAYDAWRVFGLLAAVLCTAILGGCGQKGPLSLPAPAPAPAASGVTR